jgi:ethanolamine utilization protein EutN
MSLDVVAGKAELSPEFLVAWDELGAGTGCTIALSEGPEAAMPFRPDLKPVDAYNAAILDHLEVNPELLTSD